MNTTPPEPETRVGPFGSSDDDAFEFDRYLGPEKVALARQACLLSVLLMGAFALLDLWAIPSALQPVWAIRSALVLVSLALFAFTFQPAFLRRYDLLLGSTFALLGAGIEAMVFLSQPHEVARTLYVTGVLLVLTGMFAMSFLRRAVEAAVVALLFAGYVAISIGPHAARGTHELPAVLANCAFLASVCVIGAIAQASRERHARDSFLRKRALERQLHSNEIAMRHSEYLSTHDELTGLPNRKRFERTLDAMIAAAGASGDSLAVLFVDLDGFKPVNDTHGHAAGDEVLRIVAARIRGSVSQADCVGRLGGDEFAVALLLSRRPRGELPRCEGTAPDAPADPADVACAVAARISAQLSESMRLQSATVRLGASVGRAIYPHDGESSTALLAAADRQMYSAKRLRKASISAPLARRLAGDRADSPPQRPLAEEAG